MRGNEYPLISVVMITFAHEAYIKQAVEGVLMQNYNGSVELLISNDKSPDNTELIVKEIIANHPNGSWIKYTSHAKNLGMMPNFIWTLQQAKGKYIAICEGDDYWTDPSKLQKQVDFLESNDNVVLCGTNYSKLSNNKIIEINRFKDVSFFDHFNIFADNKVATLTSIFRNDFTIPNYFYECNFGDMILYLELTKNGGKIVVLPFNSSTYRIHDLGVYSGTPYLKNVEKSFSDVLLFMNHNPKNLKYISATFLTYFKEGFVHLVRAILNRPYSDFKFSFIYLNMIFNVIKKQISVFKIIR
ncbi:hypothetical protein ASG01_12655 [Chryseobacterium sp. Leaf180]|uniref:glycosyltransferase family 2 protein n=1 Tax=Chryseobacterium sp. Leaf180 TaxID=1736289 RepID=UPI0006F2A79E|nr:glycosyltransferase [Chryseobacterium sp. Leaf180]KQR91850.1 hypothetical protein ASG01_12655 [Chryseobacterium sp. Leaf180]